MPLSCFVDIIRSIIIYSYFPIVSLLLLLILLLFSKQVKTFIQFSSNSLKLLTNKFTFLFDMIDVYLAMLLSEW